MKKRNKNNLTKQIIGYNLQSKTKNKTKTEKKQKNPYKHNYELMTYEMWTRCSRSRWRMGHMGRIFYKAECVLCSCWPLRCLTSIPIVHAAAAPIRTVAPAHALISLF